MIINLNYGFYGLIGPQYMLGFKRDLLNLNSKSILVQLFPSNVPTRNVCLYKGSFGRHIV